MTTSREELLANLLARRDRSSDAGRESWSGFGESLRRWLEACADLERDLSCFALAIRDHPERAGPYVLLRPLGEGHSGLVYLAEHRDGQRRAAVRLLKGPHAVLLREAASRATGWSHPSAVPVLQVGDDWIATEVSRGVPLSRLLVHHRRNPDPEPGGFAVPLLRVLAPVAGAIAEAHGRGLLHLGVSPRKIDFGSDGSARIRDFGFDPCRGGFPPDVEQPPLGSPHFLAPEQAGAPGAVGPATDAFSFAAVVWTVATGFPPFNSRSLGSLLALIREGNLRPLRRFAPWVPESLAEPLGRCLSRHPEERSTGLGALAGTLAAL